MAKYKAFARQGSFAENQYKVPDETGKIKEQTQRTVRGMNTAQAFLQKNQEIYLRAQQQANQVEQQTREANFQFETQNRKAFQDALKRDTEIALRNDQIQAAQTQQLYKDLSTFSKTAFALYGQYEEQRQKKQQTLAIQNVIEAGVDYKTLYEVSKLDRNLSLSAFRQTEVVKNFIDSGASEDQVRSLYNLARNNPPQRYLNTQAAYQQEYPKYVVAADKGIQDLGPDATPEQVQAFLRSFPAQYITENLPNSRPELLEKSGLLRQMRSFGNQALSGISREAANKRKREVPLQYQENLQTEYVKSGGIDAVMQQIQIDPKRWKREALADWTVNGLKSGGPNGISPDEAQQILDYPLTVGNQTTTIAKQYPDIAAQISEGIRAAKRQSVSDYNLSQTQREMRANAELAQLADSFGVDEDKVFDQAEVEAVKQKAIELGVSNSPVVQFVVENSAPEFIRRKQEEQLTELLDAGRHKEAMAILSTTQVSQKIKNQFLPTVQNMMKMYETPVVKSHLKSIEAAVSQDPRIKAAPITGASNYSVVLMKDRYVQQYKQNLQRLDPEQALSLTLQQIKTMQATPGAITKEGTYKVIEDQIKSNSQGANVSLQRVNSILAAMATKEFDRDPEWAVGVVGENVFNNLYSSLQTTGKPPELLKTLASRRGVDPITLINHLAKGAKKPPINLLNNQLKEIKDNLPPITRRLYDTYRTPERINRANTTTFGGAAPVRGNVSSNEKQALNYIAKYESESAGGYDAVNQGGAEGGTKVLGYSGPFSMMPQHGNRHLTSLTIGEIMNLQADPGSSMSMQQWINAGKLHAVGRYQFIGSTLASVVNQMGIDPNTKFTPDVQDKMALWLLRNSANGISQWVGPARYATAQERAMINAVR